MISRYQKEKINIKKIIKNNLIKKNWIDDF